MINLKISVGTKAWICAERMFFKILVVCFLYFGKPPLVIIKRRKF